MASTQPTSRILVVVAHPDDESFFFGGRMLERPDRAYDVVVVTDGGASDPPEMRRMRLSSAAGLFGFTVLSFGSQRDDDEHRLDVTALVGLLSGLPGEHYAEVWTHSPIGDYQANLHHQDTAVACALVFGDRVRYNALGFLNRGDGYRLTADHHREKVERLCQCYPAETSALEGDFLMFVGEELLVIGDLEEVVQIYAWQAGASAAAIVEHDARILDVWRRRQSSHEAAILKGSVDALVARGVVFTRALVIGDSLGLFCELLRSSGTARKTDAIEPHVKYHAELVRRGTTPVMPDGLDPKTYDAIVLFEVSGSPLGCEIPRVLANASSAHYVVSVDFSATQPTVPWETDSFIIESCLRVPASCERGASSSFLFRYPDTYAYLVRRLGRR
jgi:LmbE family N-acetylglucosaminyl deacetylase